ncbi:MAG: hypothetical protein OXB88_10930 [Bacteriovoracales bacterium]|nr:hypothetical protein [Bacteriovoracales bacterium]
MIKILLIAVLAMPFSLWADRECVEEGQLSYCVGDRVITKKGLGARIEAIFPSGKVMLKYRADTMFYIWGTSSLAKTK